jgi:hypothetical protein
MADDFIGRLRQIPAGWTQKAKAKKRSDKPAWDWIRGTATDALEAVKNDLAAESDIIGSLRLGPDAEIISNGTSHSSTCRARNI